MAQPIVSIVGTTLLEGDTNNKLLFTISLSEPLTERLDLKYVTENSTAVSGRDFTDVSNGGLTFQPGETVKTIEITISNDDISEFDENFLVNVFFPRNTTANPSSADILAATGIGTIVDTLVATTTTTLSSTIENLTLLGVAPINGTGNNASNTLTGNNLANNLIGGTGNDTLDGGLGRDTLNGGVGNDTYVFDGLDIIVDSAGINTVEVGFTYTLINPNVANITLSGTGRINATGNSRNNIIIGNINSNILTGGTGNDVIDGNAGIDTLIGGAGDDTYIVDNFGDRVDFVGEATSGGTDTVQTTFGYILGANVERLVLDGSDDIEGVGNTLANTIIGNDGDNVLDGLTGADVMTGGDGNDTYIVETIGDIVTESGRGTDSVESSINYTLRSNVENLTLTGAVATTGTGNTSNNFIVGNNLRNILTGDFGNDTLDGGVGI